MDTCENFKIQEQVQLKEIYSPVILLILASHLF